MVSKRSFPPCLEAKSKIAQENTSKRICSYPKAFYLCILRKYRERWAQRQSRNL